MASLSIYEYTSYDAFIADTAQHGIAETDLALVWVLLERLEPDEVFIRLPRWLAEEKVGYTEGGTPTEFVGRIDRTTEKALLFVDSAAARPLMKRAHRINHLEEGLENSTIDSSSIPDDEERRAWLERKLAHHREAFAHRADQDGLTDEWLPISQIETVLRHRESST
ncbi:hypothetical protein [Halocatena marina]|uniref:hypothetical protein n=1 Tax=Halocatena marina TaxID=2934937 RepID=UPI00200C945A|nr:hypothetical protein [Halocatena marina]